MKQILALTGLGRVGCHRAEAKPIRRAAPGRLPRASEGAALAQGLQHGEVTAARRETGKTGPGQRPQSRISNGCHCECASPLRAAIERAWGHGREGQ